jgi:glycosyltransferase involved in cell wall biosynthesis
LPTIIPLINKIRNFNPEVIHVHTEFGIGIEGLLISKILNKPLVGTFHTFFAEEEYIKNFGLPANKITKKLVWSYSINFYNQCKVVISPSKIVQEELIKMGLNKNPVILSNGIELPLIKTRGEIVKIREKYNVNNGINFIYIGRISREKSIDVIILAFNKIVKKHIKTNLILIGDGPEKNKLISLVKKLKMQNKVIFTGFIDRNKLISENLVLLGDVFITASKTENQPVSILEAISFGLPVIGVNMKGIPELVENNKNGFLFKEDDIKEITRHMENLLMNKKLRDRMSKGSLKIVKNHLIKNSVKKLEKIYSNLSNMNTLKMKNSN